MCRVSKAPQHPVQTGSSDLTGCQKICLFVNITHKCNKMVAVSILGTVGNY